MLSFSEYGTATDAPDLLIVHGLYGSGRNWGVIAKRLSDNRRVITVDMRNHGDSPRAPSQSYEDMAADLADLIRHIGGPMDVCGHSMGGKASMVLALENPDLVRRLIVADIAPVAYEHSQQEFIDAMRAVDLTKITRRSEAQEQLAAAGVEPALQSFFTQSLDIASKSWKLNLDVLEAEMPKIVGWPAHIRGPFKGPVFFLSGSTSHYVLSDHRPIIKELFPKAYFAKIPGAGHWLHAEKPREFEASVRAFLDAS